MYRRKIAANKVLMEKEKRSGWEVRTPSYLNTKRRVHEALAAFAALLENLSNAQLLLATPATASMLVMPPPEQPALTAEAAGTEAEAMVKRLHGQVLKAVLPLWNHPELSECPVPITMSVLAVLVLIAEGTTTAAEGERRARAGAWDGAG